MRGLISCLVAYGTVGCFAVVGAAEAGQAFGLPGSMSSHAAADAAGDSAPELATDGAGNWITVWPSEDPGLGILLGWDGLVFSRSVDDGESWSAAQLLRPEFAANSDGGADIATDAIGRWIACWAPQHGQIVVTLSDDVGLSWSPPVLLIDSATGANLFPRIATDGSGTWIVVWASGDSLGDTNGTDEDILFARSVDNGDTWSAPAALNIDAAGNDDFYRRPQIRTDGSGTWVATWNDGLFVYTARSIDDGASWMAPTQISSEGFGGGIQSEVAAGGGGRWIAIWNDNPVEDEGFNVFFSRSEDDGATWTMEALLHPYLQGGFGADAHARIDRRNADEWHVLWASSDALRGAIGSDQDILISSSRDGGASWSSPAAALTSARKDGTAQELLLALASNGAGRTILAWSSTNTLGGTIGDDSDILFAIADRDCPDLPREDCRMTTRVGGSRLTIKDGFGGADRLNWTWRYGQETTDMDLGDPTATDSLVLCLYEKVGATPGLVGEWDAKAGGTCKGAPCWTVSVGAIELRDRNLERGSIKSLSIRTGADGDARIKLRATGPALAPPRLPLDAAAPVRLQLVNLGTNVCWDGTHDQAKKNDAGQFKSTSD